MPGSPRGKQLSLPAPLLPANAARNGLITTLSSRLRRERQMQRQMWRVTWTGRRPLYGQLAAS